MFYHPHFTGEKTEAQSGKVTCLRFHNQWRGRVVQVHVQIILQPSAFSGSLDGDGAGKGGSVTVTSRAAGKGIPVGNSEA